MSRIDGLTEVYSLFASLTDDAKKDLGSRLARIGSSVSQVQRASVPSRTGNLASYLSVSETVESLRVKSGLLTIKRASAKTGGDWYGIVVEYGRHAGSKLVQRRRRVNGRLRLGSGRRKRTEDIAASYMTRWSALPARPFVHVESRVDTVISSIMSGFWDEVLAKAGA